MKFADKLRLFCKLLMATPFVILMLASLFFTGANLVAYFAGKPVAADRPSPTTPL
jgi:hypothetical protein